MKQKKKVLYCPRCYQMSKKIVDLNRALKLAKKKANNFKAKSKNLRKVILALENTLEYGSKQYHQNNVQSLR